MQFSVLDTVQSNIGNEMLEYLDQIRPFWLAGDRGRLLLDGSGLAPVAQNNNGVIETVQEQVDRIDEIVANGKTLAEGRTPIGSSKYKFNVRTNYDFTHTLLKGVGLGGGLRYWTPPVIGYNAVANSDGSVSREVIRGSDQIFVDANVSYRRKLRALGRNFTWMIQLNVDNVFDNDAYTVSRVNSANYVTAYRFNPGRSWILSTRFNF
jgi:outer membrane receptor protein involved in Fe transport